jgi:cold shock CspA family protein
VAKKHRPAQDDVAGVVKWFDADEGWGVIAAAEVPGDCFVHFSDIEGRGYRELRAGLPAGWLPVPRPDGLAPDLTSPAALAA